MGELRPGAPLGVIGEAPGENEVDKERPFVGWSGGVLDQCLWEAGLTREWTSITNQVLCRPPGNGNYTAFIDFIMRDWERKVARAKRRDEVAPSIPVLPAEACSGRLARDLAEMDAPVLLAVGKQALEAVARQLGIAQGGSKPGPGQPYAASIARQHGAPVIAANGQVLMSSYHPAMAAPGRGKSEWLPVIRENLTRAAWVAKNRYIPWVDPQPVLNPSADDVVRFCKLLVNRQAEVTVDIETDSIDVYRCAVRCIGIGADIDGVERIMVVPFRNMDGTAWWSSHAEMMRVALALREVMDGWCPLVLQNGQFDTAVLINRGLMTNRFKTWFDLLHAHRATPDNDLPHDLGFIARRYFCLRMWKADIEHRSISNVDNPVLHKYCGYDVAVEKRLAAPLRAQVAYWGTQPQLDTDTELQPILREMGMLGIVIDEERRGEFSGTLNWCAQRELMRIHGLVGDKFNPRSVPQLQDLLFGKWGYLPVIGTDGYEIDQGNTAGGPADWRAVMLQEEDDEDEEAEREVGSTSSGALIALKKVRELQPEHIEFIDALLEYRAYDKLRGTYVDNMKTYPVDWKAFKYPVEDVDAVEMDVWSKDEMKYVSCETLPRRPGLSLLHTSFKSSIPTGRLSTNPNVQNWPALGKMNMREMGVAPPEHILCTGDYAQLEGRLYAEEAEDAILLQALADGRDLHSMNAAALFAKDMDEVEKWYRIVEFGEGIDPSKRKKYRKYNRGIAKKFAFLEIYGGSEGVLYQTMASSRDKATGLLDFPDLKESDVKLWHENWHRLHPETMRWHNRCLDDYKRTGYAQVGVLDKRKRFFLGGLSRKNAVANMRIQGRAASMANRALKLLVQAIPFRSLSSWTGVILQVHDSLTVQVPLAYGERASQILTHCMTMRSGNVEFPCEVGTATRWSKTE